MVLEYHPSHPVHPLYFINDGVEENVLANLPAGIQRCPPGVLFSAEDIWYPGHTVVCPSVDSPFKADLIRTLGSTHVRSVPIVEDLWNRDPLCRTGRGVSFLVPGNQADSVHRLPRFRDFELNPPFHVSRSRLLKMSSKMSGKSGTEHGLLSNLACALFSNPDPNVRPPGLHVFPIAGGNIIAGRRLIGMPAIQDPMPAVIIGRNGVLDVAMMIDDAQIAAARMIDPTFEQGLEQDLGRHFLYTQEARLAGREYVDASNFIIRYQAAKVLLRHWIYGSQGQSRHIRRRHLYPTPEDTSLFSEDWGSHKKMVFYVDQWTYHIDLQMAYIGLGVILVHDFVMMDRLLGELLTSQSRLRNELERQFSNYDEAYPHEGVDAETLESCKRNRMDFYLQTFAAFKASNYAAGQKHQDIVNKICSTLKKAGFYPVRVGAIICPNEATPTNFGRIRKSLSKKDYLAHSCLNLIACTPGIVRETNTARFDLLVPASRDPEPFYTILWNEVERNVSAKLQQVGFAGAEIGLHKIGSEHFQMRFSHLSRYHSPISPDLYMTEENYTDTPTTYMLLKSGGLRCQTLLLSEQDVAALSPPPPLPGGLNLLPTDIVVARLSRLFYFSNNRPATPAQQGNPGDLPFMQSTTGFYTYPLDGTEALSPPDFAFTNLEQGIAMRYHINPGSLRNNVIEIFEC